MKRASTHEAHVSVTHRAWLLTSRLRDLLKRTSVCQLLRAKAAAARAVAGDYPIGDPQDARARPGHGGPLHLQHQDAERHRVDRRGRRVGQHRHELQRDWSGAAAAPRVQASAAATLRAQDDRADDIDTSEELRDAEEVLTLLYDMPVVSHVQYKSSALLLLQRSRRHRDRDETDVCENPEVSEKYNMNKNIFY